LLCGEGPGLALRPARIEQAVADLALKELARIAGIGRHRKVE